MVKIGTPAATYVPEARPGWWGSPDTRERCCGCDKVVFDQARAERSAAKATERGTLMHAYLGQCGHWHVGHGRKNRAKKQAEIG